MTRVYKCLATWVLPLALMGTGAAQEARAPLAAQVSERGDAVLLEMAQAFKRNDRRRLTALLPQARGHLLEPWAAYWELRARLDEASTTEIRQFLQRYAGTYQEDRLRNDWLLLLGSRRDLSTFGDEQIHYRMRDDREVQCYQLLLDHQAKGAQTPASLVDEVRRLWMQQRDGDEGCAWAADTLFDAKRLSALDIWRKARQSAENNRPRATRQAVQIVAPDAVGALSDVLGQPMKFLSQRIAAPQKVRQELVVLALVRIAASDPDVAAKQLGTKWSPYLTSEERHWVWGVIGRQSAMRLDDDALDHFAKVRNDRDLNDDMLGWKVRAALRAGNTPRWSVVESSIGHMSAEARRDPTWVYWLARSLLARQPGTPALTQEATSLLESIAGPRGFYEQLASEALGRAITMPERPAAPTPDEVAAARANPSLRRGLHAIAIGLRPEGVREWNYGTNLVNAQGQSGRMSDRDLLAAATLACEQQVWDRCINTSDRAREAIDFDLLFPMPHKEAVLQRTREIGLDPSYVYGLIRQESRFVMDARSGVGASGLMQVMPATARWTARKIGMTSFTPEQINQRDVNIAIGTGYLKLVLDNFEGSMPLAAAAYNAGPSRSRKWRQGPTLEGAMWAENVPFHETRDYVKKVLSNA
ncbi:MAG: lytic transglycosylase domain-containing protein, partial [Limnohabitans sp.]|nr:lytic transglycosylase domain-containing protein [Limnohabitans sp.]